MENTISNGMIGKTIESVKSIIRKSSTYQTLHNKVHSGKLAVQGKRLDICANEVALYLLQAGQSKYVLRGKVCLEVGSGWLLTHSLIFYLLGAKKIYATDICPLLQIENISKAVRKSVDWSIIDSLSIFEDREIVEARLKKLLSFENISLAVLQQLGIEYVAPIDLSRKTLGNEKIDFVFSKSVLEHVPVDDVMPLLENLESSLSENGFMFHLIHLVDHKDINNRPFDFLEYSQDTYSRELQTRWGNRIRQSQWKHIFSDLKHSDSRFLFEWSSSGKLPKKIDSSIQYVDEQDLRISHIGVFVSKSQCRG